MILSEFVLHFDGVVKRGDGYMVRCPVPVHEDRTQSLSVSNGDGTIVLYCHARCETKDVLAAIGLGMSDLWPTKQGRPLVNTRSMDRVTPITAKVQSKDRTSPIRSKDPIGPVTQPEAAKMQGSSESRLTYDYRDEDGTLLFQAVRDPGKRFRQRRADGKGGWIEGRGCMKGVRLLPYRLPELLKADTESVVYIVEGEKHVDRLRFHGLAATCNPGGAGKWRPEYSEFLQGRHVEIIPDNDVPGRKHAQEIARSLQDIAASAKVIELPDLPEKGDIINWLDAGHDVEELIRLGEAAPEWRSTGDHPPVDQRPAEPVKLPEIRISSDATAIVDAAEDALLASEHGIFTRARLLVEVSRKRAPRIARLIRAPGAPAIVQVSPARLRELMSATATWMIDRKRGRDVVTEPTLPPTPFVEMLMGRPTWSFPDIELVTETPLLRPDGTVLSEPGFDEATGTLYEPGERIYPPGPDKPTRDDAIMAVETLVEPLSDFPFVSGCDESAAIAAILTMLARPAIDGPCPMFSIDKPVQGTGGTLLAIEIGIVTTGRVPPMMPVPANEAEASKRILAIALEGLPMVVLDNITGVLQSPALSAALTATEWQDRLLGRNTIMSSPLSTVWIATGNNLTFASDIGRRLAPIRLDPKMETPEERTGFKHPDLRAYVTAERPRLVTAALTVLRAFCIAGRPQHGQPPMGSFESWDALIRSALIWVGRDDPLLDRSAVRAQADIEAESLRDALDAWTNAFEEQAVTTAAVMQRTETDDTLSGALAGLAGCSVRELDSRRLGYALRKVAGRIASGRRFGRESGRSQGSYRWKLVSS